LIGVVSQRLARRQCKRCAPSGAESGALTCQECGGTGIIGRLAVAEGYLVDDMLREAILDPSGSSLSRTLALTSFVDLAQAAAELAAHGDISRADVLGLGLA
jgi:general secretion pathway protein E